MIHPPFTSRNTVNGAEQITPAFAPHQSPPTTHHLFVKMLSLPLTNSSPLPNVILHRPWRSDSGFVRLRRNVVAPLRTTSARNQYPPSTCSLLAPKATNANADTGIHPNQNGPSSDSREGKEQRQEEEEEYKVLTAMRSMYNDIVIVDTAKSRMLLLDSSHNVHSVLNKDGKKWTESYWDEFASLPAIIPEGPIAILGLGGGTAAHLMLELWPSLQLEGWEIDEILIEKAREYFGLSDLEKRTQAGGILHVHIGDALSPLVHDSRRYAGIVVDLFGQGKVLSQLQEVVTWLELKDRLIPDGRIMVNCGGIDGEADSTNGGTSAQSVDATWIENSTMKALHKAFPGKLSWKRLPEGQGANYLALTGPLPDSSWSAMVPEPLNETVQRWRPCDLSVSCDPFSP